MLKLGLTGGIASGKTTVATMLRELNFPVLDADAIAHRLIEPDQPAYGEIVAAFGPAILSPTEKPAAAPIDRSKLGALVFADPEKLNLLNSIVHPRVAAAMLQQFAEWQSAGHPAAFVEAALLVEANFLLHLDGLVVAWCSPAQQLARLIARGFSESAALQRIASQLPVAEKLRHATDSIDCSTTLEATRLQVASLATKIRSQTAQAANVISKIHSEGHE